MATRKILLIDDDLQFYGDLSQQLTAYGFEIHQADHHERSLAMVSSLDVELIVISVDRPKKLGFALCNKAKQQRSCPPIIVKTNSIDASEFDDHRKHSSRAADAYLDYRTLTSEQLLSCVDSIIGIGERIDLTDSISIELEDIDIDDIEDIDNSNSQPSFASSFHESEVRGANRHLPSMHHDTSEIELIGNERTSVIPARTNHFGLDAETDAAFAALEIDGGSKAISQPKLPQTETTLVAPEDAFDLDTHPPNAQAPNKFVDDMIDEALDSLHIDTKPPHAQLNTKNGAGTPAPNLPSIDHSYDFDLALSHDNPSPNDLDQDDVFAMSYAGYPTPFRAQREIGAQTNQEKSGSSPQTTELTQSPESGDDSRNPNNESPRQPPHHAMAVSNSIPHEQEASPQQEPLDALSHQRDVLDLRQKINEKEKALIETQDLLNSKDREILDSKDYSRKLERDKAGLEDSNLQLEQELLKAKSLQMNFDSILEQTKADAAQAAEAHTKKLAKQTEEHEAWRAEAAAQQSELFATAAKEKKEAQVAAEQELIDRMTEAEAASQAALLRATSSLRQESKDELAQLSEQHSNKISALELGFERREHEKQQLAEKEKQALRDEHLELLETQAQALRQELKSTHTRELDDVRSKHEATLAQQREEHLDEIDQEQQKHKKLVLTLERAQDEAVARAKTDFEQKLENALETAETQKQQALDIAAEKHAEELQAAQAARDTFEAELISKSDAAREDLKQEHIRVLATKTQEFRNLENKLSTSRDLLETLEQELTESREIVEQRDKTIENHNRSISHLDERVKSLMSEQSTLKTKSADYQAQIVKAYQKIKSDEATVGRAQKALAIALTLLDETTQIDPNEGANSNGKSEAALER